MRPSDQAGDERFSLMPSFLQGRPSFDGILAFSSERD
jgi:hypothetical protein